MKTKVFLIVLLAIGLYAGNASAQTARNILDKTSAKLNKGGIQADFELTTFKGTSQQGGTSGSINVQGNKLRIEAQEMTLWYDGNTQWTLMKGTNEVNISTPEEEESQPMNPYVFVNLYKKGYNLSLKDATYQGTVCHEVRMLAQNAQAPIQEMLITISKTTLLPQSIRIRQGKNGWTRIRVSRLSTGKHWKDEHFRFNEQEHPEAEVIDLR